MKSVMTYLSSRLSSSVLVAIASGVLQAAPEDIPPPELSSRDWTSLLAICAGGRDYHDGKNLGKVEVEGWENFPTVKYAYTGEHSGQTLEVILCDPSKEKLARWIATAVTTVRGHYQASLAATLANHIRRQSQFQFPVRGLVDESSGVYAFYDGVAVQIDPEQLPTVSKGRCKLKDNLVFSKRLQDYALQISRSDVRLTGFQARLCSMSVEEFTTHKRIRERTRWNPDSIRKAYQEGWESPNNPLITEFLRNYPNEGFPD